jgi:hypothetical protein
MEQARKGKEIGADVVQAVVRSQAICEVKAGAAARGKAVVARDDSADFSWLAPIKSAVLLVPALIVCNRRSRHYKRALPS